MRILHIQLAGNYTEGMSYQENLLPGYHKKMGHEVYMLTVCYAWDKGKLIHVMPVKKEMDDGVILERIDFVNIFNEFITKRMRYAQNVYEKIEEIHPDFIMLHDIQTLSAIDLCKYMKKHTSVKLIADCHADFSNSGTNWLSRNILHGIIWRYIARRLNKYVSSFYGVLPARVDFLKKMYRLPADKCKLLLMGADDTMVATARDSRQAVRKNYNIREEDFLIVTGGKIDKAKAQTILLMKSVLKLNIKNLKLLIFGSVADELMQSFSELLVPDKIIYIGWIDSKDSYGIFAAADLAVFPGRHSVFWEQTAAQGIPMVVKDWEGTHHVDLGGNVRFLKEDSEEEITEAIFDIVNNKHIYSSMSKAACSEDKNKFLYSAIAYESLNG